VSEFPNEESLIGAVLAEWYQGAIYTIPSASGQLDTALRGGHAAINYNNTDIIRYIWNEAHFLLYSAEYIEPNFDALIAAGGLASNNWT
jgi:hypothetical protein